MLNVNVNVNRLTLKIIPPRLNHTYYVRFQSTPCLSQVRVKDGTTDQQNNRKRKGKRRL